MVRATFVLVLGALNAAAATVHVGGHGGRRDLTLSQYDQVAAEVNGTLDVVKLQQWMTETNANTMSFLLWDTDGHQYLDMVRRLNVLVQDTAM